MTRQECKKIIAVEMQIWKNYRPGNIELETDMLMRYLGGYDYKQVSMALDAYVVTDKAGFAPTPGQIIAQLQRVDDERHLNCMEAWGLVSKAIRRSGYYAREEFDKLPAAVQRAVGTPEQLRTWGIDEHYNESVAMSQFIRVYQVELQREKERAILPATMQSAIEMAYKGSEREAIAEQNHAPITMQIEEKRREGIPMPERVERRMEEMRKAVRGGE